jgi:hypothetical protein
MPRSTKRRHLLADEQLRILKVAPKPHIRIAELCCCQGIGIILPYAWREEAGQRATRATSQPKRRQGQTGTHAIAEWPMATPISPHAHRLRCPPHSRVAYCPPRPW